MPDLRTPFATLLPTPFALSGLLLSALMGATVLLAGPLSAQAPDGPVRASPASDAARITISFHETPMPDVLRTFADFAGRSIVAGPDVEGSVTAEIRDQPWDLALREILLAHGLGAVETESGIIRVGSEATLVSREEVEATVVRIFRLRWQQATELEGVVATLLSERGSVRAVESTNSLVVTDVPRVLRRVAEVLGHPTIP